VQVAQQYRHHQVAMLETKVLHQFLLPLLPQAVVVAVHTKTKLQQLVDQAVAQQDTTHHRQIKVQQEHQVKAMLAEIAHQVHQAAAVEQVLLVSQVVQVTSQAQAELVLQVQ
jgi:hypothetical protein